MTESGRACAVHGLNECPGYKMIEDSAREKLHKRHQELRKKSGLPDPDYYKELKATFDLPDEERHQAVAALKKKYKVNEAGPFSYGAKKPRKGSVADLAAKKRQEQERGKQPVEPRDHMVGVARVKKDVAEAIPYALSAANAAAEYQRQGNRHKGRIDIPVQSSEDYLAAGKALTKAARAAGQRIDYGLSDGVMSVFSDTMTANELDQFIDNALNQGLAEGSGVTKLNDYDTWLDQVDSLGAEKHMQKNQILIVAQSWDGEKVGEFDIKRNQGWVMSPGISEGVEKYLEELSRAGYEVITETAELCPECGGPAFSDQLLAEKKDACYSKVKSRYKVWPSAYASGALVRCRKVGAKNWGNKSKK